MSYESTVAAVVRFFITASSRLIFERVVATLKPSVNDSLDYGASEFKIPDKCRNSVPLLVSILYLSSLSYCSLTTIGFRFGGHLGKKI
jgi:hypothetical protein